MPKDCKCEKCDTPIDKGECGKDFSIITINKDKNDKHTKQTIYLCERCTRNFEYGFLNDSFLI